MDTTILVDKDIEDGRRLLFALRQAGFGVNRMFWVHFPDTEEYRLVIASDVVDEAGPIAAYARVKSVLDQLSPPVEIPLTAITLMSPQDQLLQAIDKIAPRHGLGSIGRIRAGGIGNMFVEDLIVYGVDPAVVRKQTNDG